MLSFHNVEPISMVGLGRAIYPAFRMPLDNHAFCLVGQQFLLEIWILLV